MSLFAGYTLMLYRRAPNLLKWLSHNCRRLIAGKVRGVIAKVGDRKRDVIDHRLRGTPRRPAASRRIERPGAADDVGQRHVVGGDPWVSRSSCRTAAQRHGLWRRPGRG